MYRRRSWLSRNKGPLAAAVAILLAGIIAIAGFGNAIKNFFGKTVPEYLKPSTQVEDTISSETDDEENNYEEENIETLEPGYNLNEDGTITYVDEELNVFTIPASMVDEFLASLESVDEIVPEETTEPEETVAPEETVDREAIISQYVEDVLSGKAGNGDARKEYLGEYYTDVMKIVNEKIASAPSAATNAPSNAPSSTQKPSTNPAPHYQMSEFYHQFDSVGSQVMINGVSHRYVKIGATTGLVNTVNEQIVVPTGIYDTVSAPVTSRGVNFVWVTNTVQRGLFNIDNREEAFMVDINAKLDVEYHFEKAYYLVTLNGKYGLIDFNNPNSPREVFTPIYDKIEFIDANSYRVWQNGQSEDISFFVPTFTGMDYDKDFETQLAYLKDIKAEIMTLETPLTTEEKAKAMI